MEFLYSSDFWFLVAASLAKTAFIIGLVLGMVSYTVYAERRVSALMQDRIGPNRTGISTHPHWFQERLLAFPRWLGPSR
jgi:NADH-quinone oxidoreductase subunit H